MRRLRPGICIRPLLTIPFLLLFVWLICIFFFPLLDGHEIVHLRGEPLYQQTSKLAKSAARDKRIKIRLQKSIKKENLPKKWIGENNAVIEATNINGT